MERIAIAAVRISDTEFAVWFGGGACKRLTADSLGVADQDLDSLALAADGAGIAIGQSVYVPSDKLFDMGEDFDLVGDEKRGILKSLSAIRHEAAFSQTRLGEAAGIRQSVISRIEGCEISPQINTLIKLLAPLGKTLAIVDIRKED